jgi:hypothetical protein
MIMLADKVIARKPPCAAGARELFNLEIPV